RGATDHFDAGTVAEAHFQQAAAEVGVAADGKDASAAPDAQPVQAARFRRPAVITTRKTTRLLHTRLPEPKRRSAAKIAAPPHNYHDKYTSLRLSFNESYSRRAIGKAPYRVAHMHD